MAPFRIAASVVCVVVACAILPASTPGFGTAAVLGQNREHERITKAALQCPGRPSVPDVPGRCFEPMSMDDLAGKGRIPFGAVGAPDLERFFEGLPHCTDGDYFPVPGYPQTRIEADQQLLACRGYIHERYQEAVAWADGLVDQNARIVPAEVNVFPGGASVCRYVNPARALKGIAGFVEHVRKRKAVLTLRLASPSALAQATAAVDLAIATLYGKTATWMAVGVATLPAPQRTMPAKCRVLGAMGRMLHGMQDFYAHGNWTDIAAPPYSIDNPRGLRRSAPAPLLDMRAGTARVAPGLVTACYTLPRLGACDGRIDHDKHLAKDKGQLAVLAGVKPGTGDLWVGKATGPRGRVNFVRAVNGAKLESRHAWTDLGTTLTETYGGPRAKQMICAITHDDPVRDCTPEAALTSVTISHYHPSGQSWSLLCGTIAGKPGAVGTITAAGPAGFGFTVPFDVLANGRRNFNSRITRAGTYTVRVEAGGTVIERTYAVPPPSGARAGPIDCSQFPTPPGG
jgi:hypothetical protein